ncbi:thioesterase family protein [Burkholderia gladioli pv. gladioli]|uniref:acyl-CoA thioesterase n=1 Tax=Burkholderia gladioli TaxID=28095 RepID=UPI0024BC33EA|nr:thioesterase family protein [Burkholderia gladioli]MDJ1164214.1 thioesterase family protein [Burkholderia gladioli pv. gladioli]
MADWLRQSKRAHHALEKSASGNGRAESLTYLTSQGFSMSALMQLRIGPVVMRDEIEYFREIYLLERVSVNLALAGLSADGSRMLLRNEFLRGDQMVARVTSSVGWLDLEKRRLTCPPSQLFDAMNALERTEQFVELPSCVKATRSS